jgi:hypothetical protein
VLVAGDLQQGLVVSRDGGLAWQSVQDAGVHAVARTTSGVLFAASERGLLRSADLGVTWTGVAGVPSDPTRALAASGAVVVAWPDQSLSLSEDDGATWRAPSPGHGFAGARRGCCTRLRGEVGSAILRMGPAALVGPVARTSFRWR